MTLLKPFPVHSDQFAHVGLHLLATDASTLGLRPGQGFERVYDDACDVGLTLIGARGREIVYYVDHTEARDGDLLYWDLRPVDNNHRSLPTIRVYND